MQQLEEANIGRDPSESDAEGVDISTDEEGGGEGHRPPEEAPTYAATSVTVWQRYTVRGGDHSPSEGFPTTFM